MRIRTESPAESTEPILSGHGAEQRSMERNYQSPARFRHAAAVVLPPRSISPDPSDYLLNISAVLISISLPPSLSFLSFCPAPVCSSARPRADTLLIAYVCTLRFHTYMYTRYRVSRKSWLDFSNRFFNVILNFFLVKIIEASIAFELEKTIGNEGVFTQLAGLQLDNNAAHVSLSKLRFLKI